MNTPNTASAAASAPTGMRTASAVRLMGAAAASDLADHPQHEIVHLLERDVGLLLRRAGGDDGLAGVVLERPLEDDVAALEHLRLDGVGVLPRRLGRRRTVRRRLHEPLLQAAA